MLKKNLIIFVFVSLIISSCSTETKKVSDLKEKNLDMQVLETYRQGMKELEDGYNLMAAKKFNEVEILFPQSIWAPKSSIMAGYSYYADSYYDDSIAELERFIRVYPLNENLDYAYYLLAMSYYAKIVDEKKDLQSILMAKKNFLFIKKNFPNTEYALDSEFKLGLINDILASKERYIGRYYFEKKKWIAAINRFKNVVDDFETTVYTEEALHRLVEIYSILGVENEAQKYATTLGYNYQSSEWYKRTYVIFNKDYDVLEKEKVNSEKNKSFFLLRKIKSVFNNNE